MTRTLISVLVLLGVLAAGHLLIDEKGYLLIAVNNHTIETSLFALAVIGIFAVLLGALVLNLLGALWRTFARSRGWLKGRKNKRQQQALEAAVWACINGDDGQLQQALAISDLPIHWQDQQRAMAARVALQQQQPTQALADLQAMSPQSQGQVAKLWLAANQGEQALTLLGAQMTDKKVSDSVVASYLEALIQAGQSEQALALLQQKYKQLDWSESRWKAYLHALFAIDDSTAQATFNALPKALRPLAAPALTQQALRHGQFDAVRGDLLKYLKKGQYQQLAEALQYAASSDPELRKLIQAALKKQPDQPELLFCLACLANAQGEHELAAKIFDTLAQSPWQGLWQQQAEQAYAKTGQFDKAYLLATQ
ncbi:heme biosynthesis HemY N-terminal domain-containing protein [Pseudoalteromonas rubra]|uniref:Heme biosynthesis protein n=1 Tax=Pseudoalteromonas rubra TaxID=43658 RepID=A0A5S3WSY3_9GAMM|nr:heme biosynthesis HemY N-terminal domain-containing protein [Pseudoalteromonas rubra]TMP32545.1 heme biosynthesis protein [Pseudoalteromonas rubra]